MTIIRPLHLTSLTGKTSFGLGPVVLSLTSLQQGKGMSAAIGSFDTPAEARSLETHYNLVPQTIHSFATMGPPMLGYSPSLERFVKARADMYNIVHQHGIWTGVSRCTNQYRIYGKGPTVVSAHGFLDTWALQRSVWRKRLALIFYERKNLYRATCLHALSIDEAKKLRSFGLCNSIAVIPNGISKDWMQHTRDGEGFRRRFDLKNETKLMLFLGRITPKKGLLMLLQAMHCLQAQLIGWKLLIAGVDEFNHRQEIERLVKELSLDAYVQFVGPQFDQDKRDAFAAADLFVLPSHSEGAPIAVLEALGSGVPVFTTKASPWEELITNNCGWWTEISVEGLVAGLQSALPQSRCTLREMGQQGKILVGEKYTWNQIAEQMLSLYNWLLGLDEQPTFIFKE